MEERKPQQQHDLVIIGGGPAGLAAAISARKAGIEDVLILERDSFPGGILNQCIHNGFGLHTFHEELTGPEYADRFWRQAQSMRIPCRLETTVIDIDPEKTVTYLNRRDGLCRIKAGAIILAMGCRERPRGALSIPGTRPAGVYTAGCAQRLMNIEGQRVGKEAVILGSGDIGLIMARRMTLEGAHVRAVAELMPYSGGLKRNIVQCLEDFGIPLKLSHTVVRIEGEQRVKGVVLAQVGADRKPIPGTEEYYPCDTLLLSVGLLPENELSRKAGLELSRVTGGAVVNDRLETSVPGIFACGNVLHVHDLVDQVSGEAALAGESAADYLKRSKEKMTRAGEESSLLLVKAEKGIRYTVPQRIDTARMKETVTLRFRVTDVCQDSVISVVGNGRLLAQKKKRVLTPGEMEQVTVTREMLSGLQKCGEIRIGLE